MPRPAGVRNHDFESKRTALLDTLTQFALEDNMQRPSLRQFAIAARASEPTLRHYFRDRQGLIIAILQYISLKARDHWDTVAVGASDTPTAVQDYFRETHLGFMQGGFARAHAFGIIEGMADETVGHAYLEYLLEPALDAVSLKLDATPGGPIDKTEQRVAAFMLLSPVLVMTLHQKLLGGEGRSPMNVPDFVSQMCVWISSGLTGDELAE